MPWEKREVSQNEVDEFVASFQERARFLVDESLGVEAALVIRNEGWDSIYVGEVGLGGRPDADVFEYACKEKLVLLTHDRDFLDDRRFPPERSAGVVVLPGAQGATRVLEMELARVIVTIGEHGAAYAGYKIRIREDATWAIRHPQAAGGTKETRLLRFDADGQIWELEEPSVKTP
jgi:predicted nuclease of predicted toxin-antitoxin system